MVASVGEVASSRAPLTGRKLPHPGNSRLGQSTRMLELGDRLTEMLF